MKNVMMMGLLLLGTASYAQRGAGNATPEQRAERQTTMMSEQLDLSAEQKKQVYDLQLARVQKMQEMREAQDRSEEARTKMRTANDDFQKQLENILTAEQKEKYQTLAAEMRDRRGGGPMPQDSTRTKRKRSRGPRE